ncbi:MAG: phytanoyl-CoA dioxygenase family protein [Alphaproteobacteria bacterium]|nr:phytanoyl-CoA dioxygenase family protein [Alphaproteobacteria bacterium]
MGFSPADLIKWPYWTLALATGAKSFQRNKIIGSQRLNRRGLHTARVRLAHGLAASRRKRLADGVSAAERAAFDRDGFVERRDVLPAQDFAEMKAAILALRAPAREMVQGDTITRRIAIDPAVLAQAPHLRRLLASPSWRGLMHYTGSFASEPLYYIQTIIPRFRDAPPDPQTDLHADTFHPTMKAWYFLHDVDASEGPFTYVPGSHRLTQERLAWEYEMSLAASDSTNRYSARGSLRIPQEQLASLGLPSARAFAVPGNTLVVGDTFGFHARGLSVRPVMRLEIFAYSRRNPFLPWAGFDPLSLPGIAERRIPALWRQLDRLEGIGLRGNSWRPAGIIRPMDPSPLAGAG